MSNATFGSLMDRLAHEAYLMRPLLPTYLHLLASAIFPIVIAAHASLMRPSSAVAKKVKKEKDSEDSDFDDESEPVQKIESLSPSDAVLFPVLAGVTLATLYWILKWLQDPAWLNYILGLYFSQLGLFFAFKFLKDTFSVIRSFVFPTTYSLHGRVYRVSAKESKYICVSQTERDSGSADHFSPLPGSLSPLLVPATLNKYLWSIRNALYAKRRLDIHLHYIIKTKTHVSILDVLALATSLSIVLYHTFISKPWPLTNFLGFSFCYGALQYTTPTTASTASLVLGALFCYDIYFVFYTPMMVTVATKLDVPIKLVFPRPDGCIYPVGVADDSEAMQAYLLCKAKKKTMAMLGLGDIVVPGMVLAFALRFDLFLFYLRKQKQQPQGNRKPTFSPATGFWGERFWTSTSTSSSTFTSDLSSSSPPAAARIAASLKARSFPKPYFYATVAGYLLGLVATVLVMQVFGHAQPALLYLVPAVLGAFWGTALVRGELGLLWRYSEAQEEEESRTDKKDVKAKEGKGPGGDDTESDGGKGNGEVGAGGEKREQDWEGKKER